MKNRISDLLRKKRNELDETQGTFAERLFPQLSPRTKKAYYSQIETGAVKFPKKYLETAAVLLGLTTDEMRALRQEVPTLSGDTDLVSARLTGDELRHLAKTANVLGKPLSIATILQILSDLRETPSE